MRTSFRIVLYLILGLSVRSLIAQTRDGATPTAQPKTYGTIQTSYYRMAASEFTLVNTQVYVYDDDFYYNENNQFLRFSVSGFGDFVASPHLPSGALITYVELDSCDSDATYDVIADLYLCDNLGNCGLPKETLASSNNGTIPCGFTSAAVSGIQVDNYRNQITVRVNTGSGTESTRFAGVVLGYVLQVSQPPAFPDFNDVPTTSPQYPFIEALYNSGITAGCGGGNYCPDNPLTRGQMAVFLAKALGLQFQ